MVARPGRRPPTSGVIALAALLAIAAFVAGFAAGGAAERAESDRDGEPTTQRYRPVVHFTPAQNWMNDPNGPIYADGRYHLFYQYNPFGNLWGNIGWGHAVSSDLIEWEELPMALAADPPDMAFSGSAVVDSDDTSGLCDGAECLVAAYTGLVVDPATAITEQDQRIAVSRDGGASFQPYDGNPVIDLDLVDFRDPNVFWHEPTGRWILAVALPIERMILFFASDNLVDWEQISEFGAAGVQDGLWECPVLIELPIVGRDETRWVLKVDHNPGHITGGSGAQYFVGDFDGTTFTAETPGPDAEPLWVDYGADFYCAMTFSNEPAAESGRTWIGWMSNWDYASVVPTHPWRGAMTLPRTVVLTDRDGALRLTQRPTASLDDVRFDHRRFEGPSVAAIAEEVVNDHGGDVLDIVVDVVVGEADRIGVDVAVGDRSAVRVHYDTASETLTVDRTRSGEVGFAPGFAAVHSAPLVPIDGTVSMRIVLDRSSIEVFADDGRVVLTDLIFPAPGATGVALISEGGPTGPVSLDVWGLRPPSQR
jgi:fructan beta-fructosidase